MSEHIVAKCEIQIDAPVSKVWAALTDPAMIKQYMFGTDTDTTWEVGSPITFSGEWDGKAYTDKGKILENQPPNLLQFTHWSSMSGLPDLPENYYAVSYHLVEEAGGTHLTVTQDQVPSAEAKEGAEKNWAMVLTKIKELLE